MTRQFCHAVATALSLRACTAGRLPFPLCLLGPPDLAAATLRLPLACKAAADDTVLVLAFSRLSAPCTGALPGADLGPLPAPLVRTPCHGALAADPACPSFPSFPLPAASQHGTMNTQAQFDMFAQAAVLDDASRGSCSLQTDQQGQLQSHNCREHTREAVLEIAGENLFESCTVFCYCQPCYAWPS